MRVEAFEAVGGFSSFIVAGEEPDLCFRMREKRWKIWRLEEEMTRHDAAMANFSGGIVLSEVDTVAPSFGTGTEVQVLRV